MDKKIFIMHRGKYSDKYPENSIPAFNECINNNKMIEFDVHIIKDGTVVVFHDDNLSRVCGVNLKIKNLNYDELKKYKLNNSNYSIPTFTQVLELVNGKVPLDIELKCDVMDGSLEKSVVNILKNYKGTYILKSFNPLIVKRLKSLRRKYKLNFKVGLLLNKKSVLISTLFITNPDFISYSYKLKDKWTYKLASSFYPTLIYTIKSKEIINSLSDYNYRGYIVENYEDILD